MTQQCLWQLKDAQLPKNPDIIGLVFVCNSVDCHFRNRRNMVGRTDGPVAPGQASLASRVDIGTLGVFRAEEDALQMRPATF